jgi:hypothetical protein
MCAATTPDGNSCQARPLGGSDLCYFHNPDKAQDRKLASQRGGKNRITLIPRQDVELMPLRTPAEAAADIDAMDEEEQAAPFSPGAGNFGNLHNTFECY